MMTYLLYFFSIMGVSGIIAVILALLMAHRIEVKDSVSRDKGDHEWYQHGHWEVVDDKAPTEMCRVRWSNPDEHGRYLWVAHYPIEMRHSCERQAELFNKEHRSPLSFDGAFSGASS